MVPVFGRSRSWSDIYSWEWWKGGTISDFVRLGLFFFKNKYMMTVWPSCMSIVDLANRLFTMWYYRCGWKFGANILNDALSIYKVLINVGGPLRRQAGNISDRLRTYLFTAWEVCSEQLNYSEFIQMFANVQNTCNWSLVNWNVCC